MQETGSESMFDLAGCSYDLSDLSRLDLDGVRESLESIESVRYKCRAHYRLHVSECHHTHQYSGGVDIGCRIRKIDWLC